MPFWSSAFSSVHPSVVEQQSIRGFNSNPSLGKPHGGDFPKLPLVDRTSREEFLHLPPFLPTLSFPQTIFSDSAAKHYLAYRISLMGHLATIPSPSEFESVDLLVTNPTAAKHVTLSICLSQGETSEGLEVPMAQLGNSLQDLSNPQHFLAVVELPGPEAEGTPPRVHLLSSSKIHEYLNSSASNESSSITLPAFMLQPHEEAWDVLHRALQVVKPQLGVFWIHQGKLLKTSQPWEDLSPVDGTRCVPGSLEELWTEKMEDHLGAIPRLSKVPRGRIVMDGQGQVVVLTSQQVHDATARKLQIVEAFDWEEKDVLFQVDSTFDPPEGDSFSL